LNLSLSSSIFNTRVWKNYILKANHGHWPYLEISGGVEMSPSLWQKMLLLLKKILSTGLVVVQGTVIGLGLNYSWHYFLAEYLAWGDSAPNWYFQVQGIIFTAFFLLGLIGWVLFYPRLDGYLTRKHI
jgi:hypothetical protein